MLAKALILLLIYSLSYLGLSWIFAALILPSQGEQLQPGKFLSLSVRLVFHGSQFLGLFFSYLWARRQELGFKPWLFFASFLIISQIYMDYLTDLNKLIKPSPERVLFLLELLVFGILIHKKGKQANAVS